MQQRVASRDVFLSVLPLSLILLGNLSEVRMHAFNFTDVRISASGDVNASFLHHIAAAGTHHRIHNNGECVCVFL